MMPGGLGKTVKVAVFTSDSLHDKAKEAGADVIGNDQLLKEVKYLEL
jgi:large subunit ribosomal protein L1